MPLIRAVVGCLLLLSCAVPGGAAGNRPDPTRLTSADGRREVRAARATAAVKIDGQLDDEVWTQAEPTAEFVQSEPLTDQPATEETEVQIAYDDSNLYVAAYLRDSMPGAVIVNDIRKDFDPEESDTFEVILDTFADRRNGFVFMTNVEGARADQQSANEGREVNASWDAVWFVKTSRVEDGWIAEMAIPFRSLRYERDGSDIWGINFSRRLRRRNEVDFWSPIPREFSLSRVSLAGNLIGLAPPGAGRNLRVKPYALARGVRETGDTVFDRDGEVGLDVKYGVTPAMTLDATVNPDFAQAEADEQTVNLTQFSEFFPEKRDFFLENSGIFYIGDAQRQKLNPTPTPDEDMLLFHSRRIGLTEEGTAIPIIGGARLTGRAGGVSLGVLSMQTRSTDTTPANLYTVARVRRDVAAGSDVGAFFMTRQSTDDAGDYNRVFGADGNWRMFGRLDWNSYLAKTVTPGRGDGQYVARTTFNWEDSFFHGKGGVLAIGENFQSDLAYYRRTDVIKYILDFGIRWRPDFLRARSFREQHPHWRGDYYTDFHGRRVASRQHYGYQWQHNDGANGEIAYNPTYEVIATPFRIARGTPPIPAGTYSWTEHTYRFTTNTSLWISGGGTFIHGGLWSGTQRGFNANVTLRATHRFRLRASIQKRWVELEVPKSDFVTNVITVRPNYSFNPNMFLDALLQYSENLDQFNANVRFNLIHRPLSDLFVVYNEQRFVEPGSPPAGRGFIVKFTQMMAF
jgi:hypothetical protein